MVLLLSTQHTIEKKHAQSGYLIHMFKDIWICRSLVIGPSETLVASGMKHPDQIQSGLLWVIPGSAPSRWSRHQACHVTIS